MPYVPSKKTDGKSTDREVIDATVEVLANEAASQITDNRSLIKVYKYIFLRTARALDWLLRGERIQECNPLPDNFAGAIFEVAKKYNYDGAELGEFNYAITRFIQRVPGIKVERKEWEQELRYWVYAMTVEALTFAHANTFNLGLGIAGVFEDIKDEYKRRVNTAYEAEQILKSGDCYETPFYTRLVRVVDDVGNLIGHMEVMLKRGTSTISKDTLDLELILKRKQ